MTCLITVSVENVNYLFQNAPCYHPKFFSMYTWLAKPLLRKKTFGLKQEGD